MNKDKDSVSNPFREMKAMIATSIGRIPAALVVIFAVAIAIAALSGLFLKISTENRLPQNVFMPLRLEVDSNTQPIDLKKLQGQWIYQNMDYAMSLAIIGDRFEWIVKFGSIKEAQFYARGNYRIDGNVIILGQRPDLGKPYDESKPWIKFLPMAMKDVNAYIAMNGKDIVLTIPSSEQAKILSHTADIFNGNKYGRFEWVKR